MHWNKLHRLLAEAVHTLSCFCFLIYLFEKTNLARKKKQKNIGEFKIGERFNPQNVHTHKHIGRV